MRPPPSPSAGSDHAPYRRPGAGHRNVTTTDCYGDHAAYGNRNSHLDSDSDADPDSDRDRGDGNLARKLADGLWLLL